MPKKRIPSPVDEKKAFSPRLDEARKSPIADLYALYGSSLAGLSNEEQLEKNRQDYGRNVIVKGKKKSFFLRFLSSFANPFSVVLLVLAGVSLITDVVLAKEGEKNPTSSIIILSLVVFSGVFRFAQENRSTKAVEKLAELVENTTPVFRYGKETTIPLDELVVGDVVALSVGDVIPADVRLLTSKDFFVSQSSLTGESVPLEKTPLLKDENASLLDSNNLAFFGSNVVSGSALALVIEVGNGTILGKMAQKLKSKNEKTAFDKGIDSVSWLLVRFMLVMVPAVFLINGFTKHDWLQAFLFAISVAVGLTPEMLPMIVTSCLAKGAIMMGKKKVIIKNINSIQNFGAMDVLCTDKTGTLTQDRVVLESHLNIDGKEDIRVLRHAFLNSYYQTGLKNLMDKSIMEKTFALAKTNPSLENLDKAYSKVDEIPFDFARKRMSVVVKDANGKTQLITKGAVEEILSVCSYVEINGGVSPLDDRLRNQVLQKVEEYSRLGFRVIAVAQKSNPSSAESFGVKDESEMVLIGYLTFFDPPKESASLALKSLQENGVETKILTGDSLEVTSYIADKLNLPFQKALLGSDIEKMDDDTLSKEVETTKIFAKLSPDDKARVVLALRKNGHVVGYMGDGINDALALSSADIAISVDTAVDIAKENAHVILLEKDLSVLVDGIIEGRKTYANMIKYIKMTASSNFGNIFSELLAAAFLPFLPMLPLQLLILNLVYDCSCIAIPFDNVDEEYLKKPRRWDATGLGRFMLWMGPTSSIFDATTYLVMYFLICPLFAGGAWGSAAADKVLFIALFQSGWFVESMWSQSFVIHMIRTPRIPFIQSRASWQVSLSTLCSVGLLTVLPFIPYANSALGLTPLPWPYFIYLPIAILCYMLLATLVKNLYKKRYGEIL